MKYEIVHPVEHDGMRHESGPIDLSPQAAAPLLAIGAIVEAVKPAKTKRGPKRKTAGGIEGDPGGADDQDDDDDLTDDDSSGALFDDEHTDVP